MIKYPTRGGIAVPPQELALPDSRYGWDKERYQNNHHAHYYERMFGRTAVTQCLRDLERHQHDLPIDIHSWLHDTYGPPAMPTEQQAAKEVIDAYDCGERFKRYDRGSKRYEYHDIPKEVADAFVAKYGLIRVFDMAAD